MVKSKRLDKVPFRFDAGKRHQEYIYLEDGGSDGYNDNKEFHGKWWETLPDSRDYGHFGFKQHIDGNPIRKDAYDDSKINGVDKKKNK
tara:strand:+ start:3104 stop:3367 length:264 start_codon:yes stop_codon:yes gene_type:complete